MKSIAIASDHAGVDLKAILIQEIENLGLKPIDLGTNSTKSVDYPDYADMLSKKIISGSADAGIAICGTGIGISIALNRNNKIRAALCHNEETAKLARQHNDANVLVLGARVVDDETAKKCLRIFLMTDFEGGRHQTRVDKLTNISPLPWGEG